MSEANQEQRLKENVDHSVVVEAIWDAIYYCNRQSEGAYSSGCDSASKHWKEKSQRYRQLLEPINTRNERRGCDCVNNVPAVCEAIGYPCDSCNTWEERVPPSRPHITGASDDDPVGDDNLR
jgi:hypothetical protein